MERFHRRVPSPFAKVDPTFRADPVFLIASLSEIIYAVRSALDLEPRNAAHDSLSSVHSCLLQTLEAYLHSPLDSAFEDAIQVFRNKRVDARDSLTFLKQTADPAELNGHSGLDALRSLQQFAVALEKILQPASVAKLTASIVSESDTAPRSSTAGCPLAIRGFASLQETATPGQTLVQFSAAIGGDQTINRISRTWWEQCILSHGLQSQSKSHQRALFLTQLRMPLVLDQPAPFLKLRDPVRLDFELTEDSTFDIFLGRQFSAQHCVLSSEEAWLAFDEKYYCWLRARQDEVMMSLPMYDALLPSPQRGSSREADKANMALWTAKQQVARIEEYKERTEAAARRREKKAAAAANQTSSQVTSDSGGGLSHLECLEFMEKAAKDGGKGKGHFS